MHLLQRVAGHGAPFLLQAPASAKAPPYLPPGSRYISDTTSRQRWHLGRTLQQAAHTHQVRGGRVSRRESCSPSQARLPGSVRVCQAVWMLFWSEAASVCCHCCAEHVAAERVRAPPPGRCCCRCMALRAAAAAATHRQRHIHLDRRLGHSQSLQTRIHIRPMSPHILLQGESPS